MIVRDAAIPIDAQAVSGAVSEFMRTVRPRLDVLHDAYAGRGAITRRERGPGLPNNRLSHAFPRYIVTMAAGYLAGSPVQYAGEDKAGLDALLDAYSASDMQSVDAELATQASIYGRGVCVCYVDEARRPRAATLDPRQAFVVYDDTVEHRPIFAVHWYGVSGANGLGGDMVLHVHTKDAVMTYRGGSLTGITGAPAQVEAHYFGSVPVVEFWNSADEMGDFEPVLSLIEAYDVLESDRVNDKQQFTDAILLLTGCVLENDDPQDTRSPAQKLIEERTLSLPDTDAHAQWLIKQSDEAGTEVLKNALKADIHKMSLVPDLTDEQFASNASGVAMRYKLLGLEQLTKSKERWFREGLRARLRLFAHVLGVLAVAHIDAQAVEMSFMRSLPVNESETAQMVAQLQGIVPDEILLAQLPFVEDARAALEQLHAQSTMHEDIVEPD